jgi:hypothetical protein
MVPEHDLDETVALLDVEQAVDHVLTIDLDSVESGVVGLYARDQLEVVFVDVEEDQ